MEKSEEYMQWMKSREREKYENDRAFWLDESRKKSKTIDSLTAQVQAFQAEIKVLKKREKELLDKLNKYENENEKHVNDNFFLENCVKIKDNDCEKLRQELVDSKALYRKTKSDMQGMRKEILLSIQEEHEVRLAQRDEKAYSMSTKQAKRHNVEIEKLKKSLMEEHERDLGKLQKKIREKEAMLKTQKKEQEDTEDAKRDCENKNKRYKAMQKELEEKISDLERRDLTPKVAALEATVEERGKVIAIKKQEISILRKEKSDVMEDWRSEQDKNAVLLDQLKEVMDKNKHLEDELKEIKPLFKKMAELEIPQTARIQTETRKNIEANIKARETEIQGMRERVLQLETYGKRFKADLLACVSVITEPKKLKCRVVDLKKRYIDNEYVQMNEETEAAYQHKIDCLNKKVEFFESINQTQARTKKYMDKQLEKGKNDLSTNLVSYIESYNEEARKVHVLQKELKQATCQLQEATKLTQQIVTDPWIRNLPLKCEYKDETSLPCPGGIKDDSVEVVGRSKTDGVGKD